MTCTCERHAVKGTSQGLNKQPRDSFSSVQMAKKCSHNNAVTIKDSRNPKKSLKKANFENGIGPSGLLESRPVLHTSFPSRRGQESLSLKKKHLTKAKGEGTCIDVAAKTALKRRQKKLR